jgi:hypothetical protein
MEGIADLTLIPNMADGAGSPLAHPAGGLVLTAAVAPRTRHARISNPCRLLRYERMADQGCAAATITANICHVAADPYIWIDTRVNSRPEHSPRTASVRPKMCTLTCNSVLLNNIGQFSHRFSKGVNASSNPCRGAKTVSRAPSAVKQATKRSTREGSTHSRMYLSLDRAI